MPRLCMLFPGILSEAYMLNAIQTCRLTDTFASNPGNKRTLYSPAALSHPFCPAPSFLAAGPTLRFHCPALVALAGATFSATLDDAPLSWGSSFMVQAGQVLAIGQVSAGKGVWLSCLCHTWVSVLVGGDYEGSCASVSVPVCLTCASACTSMHQTNPLTHAQENIPAFA